MSDQTSSSLLNDLSTNAPQPKTEKVGVNPVPVTDELRAIDMNTMRPVVKIDPADVVIVQNVDNGKFDIMSANIYESRVATPSEKGAYRGPDGKIVEVLTTDKGHIVLDPKKNYQLSALDEQYFDQRFTKL